MDGYWPLTSIFDKVQAPGSKMLSLFTARTHQYFTSMYNTATRETCNTTLAEVFKKSHPIYSQDLDQDNT